MRAARGTGGLNEPTIGATAEILEILRVRGACFAGELAETTRRLPDDITRGLWDGVSRGLFTCDGFGAIRTKIAFSTRSRSSVSRLSRLMRAAGSRNAAGRWSVVPTPDPGIDPDEVAEAVAEMLLHRWGVVFRDLVLHESIRFPWREVQRALRRLEDRGLVRGGRFVTGFSGEQFALPSAVQQLAHMRKVPCSGERVVANATDPLNVVGVLTNGAPIPSIRTRQVIYVDGVPEESMLNMRND